MNWETLRDRMVQAFAEVGLALTQCRNEEDLLLVLEIVERYPAMAKSELRSSGIPTGRRIDAMRAAVREMRTTLEPDKKKGGT